MLQHNAKAAALKAHAAHAAVVGGHLFCCGAPAVMMLFAAGAGASLGVSTVQRFFLETHSYLHAHEIWILAVSALLVSLGGWLEWRSHHGRRLSLFFVLSVLCFTLNAGVIAAHRTGHPAAYLAAAGAPVTR